MQFFAPPRRVAFAFFALNSAITSAFYFTFVYLPVFYLLISEKQLKYAYVRMPQRKMLQQVWIQVWMCCGKLKVSLRHTAVTIYGKNAPRRRIFSSV